MKKSKLLNVLGSDSEENKISRRDFLKIIGAGTATAAVTGCADSAHQNIFGDLKGDPHKVPGVAQWFSSTCTECSAGCGVRVRVRDGRAVKLEGSTESPVNRGGLCAGGQSALQGLYDPDRVREPIKRKVLDVKGYPAKEGVLPATEFQPVAWDSAMSDFASYAKAEGRKVIFTSELSGTSEQLVQSFAEKLKFDHVVFDTTQPLALAKATELVYGVYCIPEYHLDKADLIVNFGADFLETWINPCGYARDWAKSRKTKTPSKVIHIEPRLSLTGANADKWCRNTPGSELAIAKALLKTLVDKAKADASELQKISEITKDFNADKLLVGTGLKREDLLLMVDGLTGSKAGLVLAGGTSSQSESQLDLQVIVALINKLVSADKTTLSFKSVRVPKSNFSTLTKLIKDMKAGKVETLIIWGDNPAYSLPASSEFQVAVKYVRNVVVLSEKLDESAQLASLVLPTNHALESWGDRIPQAGVHSFMQPTMSTVFNTKQAEDILLEVARLVGSDLSPESKTYAEYLKNAWKTKLANSANSELAWRKNLESGIYIEEVSALSTTAISDEVSKFKFSNPSFKTEDTSNSDPVLYPYSSVKTFDGRLANRPWLQELPDPITQVAWDVWAEIHPDTAKKLSLDTGDMIQLTNKQGQLNLPVYITEFVHPEIVAVPMGGGHKSFGRYAEQIEGGNVLDCLSPVKTSASLALFSARVKLQKGLGTHKLANVQGRDSQMGRELAQYKKVNLADDHKHDDHHHHHEPKQVYQQREHAMHRWGMAVDLAACTGCSACVVACYAENNIPTVGRRVMNQGREMSWLRIERYYDNPAEELHVSFLPMMCQHCNNAPCEPVCPVYATYHNEEGINAMIYNRCVGTRYCSNNCSYKVRRFNWFEFDYPEPLNWQLNPDVMKRVAGVMEKCSFCVQRISEVKDHAKDEGRLVADGEVKPACVQSCPTEALVFGDLNDPNSKVSKLSKDERAYKILDHHLNTQPAIAYLQDLKFEI